MTFRGAACQFKWGLDKKERGGVFEGGDTPIHTMIWLLAKMNFGSHEIDT